MRRGMDIALGQGGMHNGDRRLAAGALAKFSGADQHRHVAVRMLVFVHQLMSDRDFLVSEGPR